MAIKAAIFDAYGTLLDVGSATTNLVAANHYPNLAEKSDQLNAIWRNKQLHYTWLRTIMGRYISFWDCTCDSLDVALAETGLAGDKALRSDLLSLYRTLSAYDDAERILGHFGRQAIPRAILSNGNHEMLSPAITAASLSDHLEDVLSVDDIGIYKPAPQVYELVCRRFDITADEVLFFSANGWDIAGAHAFGFNTIWINRFDQTPDRLGDGPHFTVSNLDEAWEVAAPLLTGH